MKLAVCLVAVLYAAAAGGQCCGDCDGDGVVTVNELVRAVAVALDTCPAFATVTPTATTVATHLLTETPAASPTETALPTTPPALPCDNTLIALTRSWRYSTGTFEREYCLEGITISSGVETLIGIGLLPKLTAAVVQRIVDISPNSGLPYDFIMLEKAPDACNFFFFERTLSNRLRGDAFFVAYLQNGDCAPVSSGFPQPFVGMPLIPAPGTTPGCDAYKTVRAVDTEPMASTLRAAIPSDH